jgi:hypothetical protein
VTLSDLYLAFPHAFAAPSLEAVLSLMITGILLIASFCLLAFWIYRKYAIGRDDMGKKEDDIFLYSDRSVTWGDNGDELSFRRRM